MDNSILLYLADTSTDNSTNDTSTGCVLWRDTVVTINKYTVIKASAIDSKLIPNTNIIEYHIPDFLTIPFPLLELKNNSISRFTTSRGCIIVPDSPLKSKLCSISPSQKIKDFHRIVRTIVTPWSTWIRPNTSLTWQCSISSTIRPESPLSSIGRHPSLKRSLRGSVQNEFYN